MARLQFKGYWGDSARWHPQAPRAACLAEIAGLVASASGQEIRLWTAETGKLLKKFKSGSRDQVLALAFASGGERLAVGSDSADEGRTLGIFTRQGKGYKLERTLAAHYRTSALAADGDRLASGGGEDDGALAVWDLASGERLFEQAGDGEIAAVALQGPLLAASRLAEDEQVELWDLQTNSRRWVHPGRAPRRLVFQEAGLLAGDLELDLETGSPLGPSRERGLWVECQADVRVYRDEALLWASGEVGSLLVLASSAETLWGGSSSGLVVAWDLASGRERWRARPGIGTAQGVMALVALPGAVAAWAADHCQVLAEADGSVLLEGPANLVAEGPRLGMVRLEPPGFVGELAPGRLWSGPCAAPHDGTSCWFGLTRRELDSGRILEELPWDRGMCYFVRCAAGWRWGTNGYWTALWEPGQSPRWFQTAAARPEMIAVHPGRRLLVASRGYELVLWDVDREEPLEQVSFAYPQRADCLAITAAGDRLLVGSMTGLVACYQIPS